MPKISVKIDQQELARVRGVLRAIGKDLKHILPQAVNDTVKEVGLSQKNPKSVLKQITDKVNIKAGALRKLKVIRVDRAVAGHRPTGQITLSESSRISLKEFGARQTARGVTYKIEKAGPRKQVPSAFGPGTKETNTRGARPKVMGGHIFKRILKARLPVRKLRGPSPWGVFLAAGGPEIAAADAEQRLHKNIHQRLNFLLLKAQGKI